MTRVVDKAHTECAYGQCPKMPTPVAGWRCVDLRTEVRRAEDGGLERVTVAAWHLHEISPTNNETDDSTRYND